VKALQNNIANFEAAHGEIKEYQQPTIPINFDKMGEA
jgi:hypothetical protein